MPTPIRRAATRHEEVSQARVIAWSHLPEVRKLAPELRWLHHSPNGGKRDAFTGAQLKALGVKPGFPDLILPVKSPACATCPGLVIEMKTEEAGSKTSPKQDEWLAHFKAQGWHTAVARTAEEARITLCNYLEHDPNTMPELDA